MANRKNLKKNINYICGELFAECVSLRLYTPGTNPKAADEVMTAILNLQNEFISRISHTEPGNVKGFYKKLKEDFNKQVIEITDLISNL